LIGYVRQHFRLEQDRKAIVRIEQYRVDLSWTFECFPNNICPTPVSCIQNIGNDLPLSEVLSRPMLVRWWWWQIDLKEQVNPSAKALIPRSDIRQWRNIPKARADHLAQAFRQVRSVEVRHQASGHPKPFVFFNLARALRLRKR